MSTLMSELVKDDTQKFGAASKDFKCAAAVASLGMLLRGSEHKGDTSYDAVLEIPTDGTSDDKTSYQVDSPLAIHCWFNVARPLSAEM